jgi:AcrR family transcriptional regulator
MASKIRERILTHAVRCFAAHGYAGSSTKEIAGRADVTEGSLFRLYSSKEKLFSEALALVLSSKPTRRTHIRFVAFALLEGKGITDLNRKALRRYAAKCPTVRELLAVSKITIFTILLTASSITPS